MRSLLTAPIEAGKAFDFQKLGDVASFAVVPKQPSASDYSPPKEIEIDVTRAVKQIAAGEATFRGLAIRVVQDRSIDEGYLTRVDLAAGVRPYLMLEVYDKNWTRLEARWTRKQGRSRHGIRRHLDPIPANHDPEVVPRSCCASGSNRSTLPPSERPNASCPRRVPSIRF